MDESKDGKNKNIEIEWQDCRSMHQHVALSSTNIEIKTI